MNFQSLFSYFLRGLLLVVPVGLTIYIIIEMVQWTDSLLPIQIPGLGILTVFFVTALVGYLANTIFAKPFFDLFSDLLKKIPLVNFIYTSINDLVTAFVGDKKKFDTPVLVPFDENGVIYKPGFITQKDLAEIGLPGMVTVYLPHSYNFSGNVFIVDKSKLITLSGNNTDIMKYVVSGGISGRIKVKQ
ncbi:DUF502 domain-containing protein [Marinoscillum furvescens]|uniref:Putative membrane protein n=1 Tax=Marinoscillum furvescens DSM 4134 TaxID=1122208 RepID=A0A3D9KZE1_MARFU|nr:DUF502 domain-containing protein [Marinoscillum furvescens]RED93195.1 putative membrane protein [Marinoscillum furvescens DSM 4134]